MISFFKNLKANLLKTKSYKLNAGMTYVELIVVLSIFASLSTVVIFNYSEFQSKIDIKNLSSDIALKVVEAQKSAMSGRQPPPAQRGALVGTLNWKPSYGIYLNRVTDDEIFYFFTDLDQNSEFDKSPCPGSEECLEKVIITKGNRISDLSFFNRGDTTQNSLNDHDLTITFIRPSGSAIFKSTATSFDPANVDYVQITVKSPKDTTANIKIYSSGNIDIR